MTDDLEERVRRLERAISSQGVTIRRNEARIEGLERDLESTRHALLRLRNIVKSNTDVIENLLKRERERIKRERERIEKERGD